MGGIAAFGAPFIDSIAPVVWGVQNENLLTCHSAVRAAGRVAAALAASPTDVRALSAWLGRLPGGLLHTNIGSCALFAATSGSSVATAATIGTVALPSLHARSYSMRASLGSLAAGGTLGILIPPSVNMIVYGSLTNKSIGKLFIAGIVPGILLSLTFMLWIYVVQLAQRSRCARKRCRRSMSGSAAVQPGAAGRRVRHRDGQPVFRHRDGDRIGRTRRDRRAVFRWQAGKLSFELLRTAFSDRADQRDDPADHRGGVHPQPRHQPHRRRRSDDQMGDLVSACRPRR